MRNFDGKNTKNVYFITGTAYAGKSTMVKMLAERYDIIFCGENYHSTISDIVATPDAQPDICFMKNLTGKSFLLGHLKSMNVGFTAREKRRRNLK